ncbi:MAG: SDR family oxidoreductase [Pirellulaceae bacterium]|nr:SDR family oxidoreductase [Pirellulaceae bacterium]
MASGTSGEFTDRQAIVTGGTSGIGQAVAGALQRAGCRVLVTGHTRDEVRRFHESQSVVAEGRPFEAVELDVGDPEAVRGLAESVAELQILVNCAGTIEREGREHDPAVFARVVDVNLNGTMRACSAFRPHLVASRGCIVNTASMLSIFGSGHVPAYSASKGGIVQLTRSLAIAWAREGVRVNAVAPGWIETPLTRPLVDDAARRDEIIRRTPLGRWGRPDDVAGAVLFLCCDAARFITGVVLPVDGGYSIC